MVYRVLQNLLILDGERLSYRTLDVEQIGSVYETIMGFDLEVAEGRCIAIRPTKPHGAPTTINLEELLAVKPAERAKWIKEKTDQSLTGLAAAALKEAGTIEGIVAALEKNVARAATPNIVPAGAMILQPSDERRRSGSHYTPRTLTEPIVRTTLRPILERLGANPTPEQILDLKICDPAMGSGAFLVAVCRFLAELLVKAWHSHDRKQSIPPDEDEILHAARIVAQRCLYGVDKNPLAVDLAKLSLWLATLAKDHSFTFLDHALKCGDSLVGLTKAQILAFHWKPEKQRDFARAAIEGQLNRALEQRRQIREAPDGTSEGLLRERLQAADGFINLGRRYGDLVISAFFAGDNDRKRKERLESLSDDLANQRSQFDVTRQQRLDTALHQLRRGPLPVIPFHWEIEFPEVFDRPTPGFDAFVGNPPFMGGTRMSEVYGMAYFQWLVNQYPHCEHHCDLVAYFFRRCFHFLNPGGSFGLIATNTISQGDTREGGLREILRLGGTIYSARTRMKWPGLAAVTVSTVNVIKSHSLNDIALDGKAVSRISAYLLMGDSDDSPFRLTSNPYFSLGCKIYGQGFLFDDEDPNCTPIEVMNRILSEHPEYASHVLPYIGGEELNSHPRQMHSRYAINLSDVQEEVDLARWADLRQIVISKVRPERELLGSNPNNVPLKRRWWAYQAHRPELFGLLKGKERALCHARVSQYLAFAFLPARMIFSEQLVVFDIDSMASFAVLQSRVHELWARFFASSLEDRLRYTPSDCYETFPLPNDLQVDSTLQAIGCEYYDFRASLMIGNNEGLTKTYNHFHDPDERSPDIAKLRELHAAMDRAVLDAYGWTDLKPTCKFLLDYEEDEDDDDESGGRRRKKPWRYRWPDEFRDEVLARLLELNRQRAEMERLTGVAGQGTGAIVRKGTRTRKVAQGKAMESTPDMFAKDINPE